MAESGSSLSKIMTDLFLKERSVLHVLKKTEHLRRLRKRLKKDIKKISPLLAPLMPKWSEDFEHSFISVNLFITEINLLLRINNPVITERAKKFWTDFWESSDDEEKEEFESACGDFSGEEEERNEETNWESILSLLKKLVNAVTELKGAALEDGELEEILRDLKNLPELEDVVDNIPEDLLVGVGEASIHERKLVNAVTELKGAALEDGELEEILRDLKNLPELEDVVDNIPEDLLVGVGEASIHERKLVNAVTELKGAALEDGELEEIVRDLKNLPELEDVVDNIPEDLLVGVGEASIHERKLVNAFTELKGAALEDGELEEILRDLKNLPELEDVVDNIPEDLLVGVGEASIHERKLVNAVTELKGAALEDGELEEIVRDLKNLPELEDVVDNIPEDLLVGVGEASIHER